MLAASAKTLNRHGREYTLFLFSSCLLALLIKRILNPSVITEQAVSNLNLFLYCLLLGQMNDFLCSDFNFLKIKQFFAVISIFSEGQELIYIKKRQQTEIEITSKNVTRLQFGSLQRTKEI